MKKILLMMLSCVLFAACSDEPKEETSATLFDQLIGEWVYDHPEEGVWEVQKFVNSGVFYYSNKVTGDWEFENNMNPGRFWVDDNNRVTCQFSINGVATQVNMTVLAITPYAYTAQYNDGGALGTFTYARLLSKVQLKPMEKYMPDYSGLVAIPVKGFRSHDSKIATVNTATGEITGVASGRTYIDVITDQGIAVVAVTVFDEENMFADYSFAFGKTIPEIVEIMGEDYTYREDTNGVIYKSNDYLTDEIHFITGQYDDTHVEFVRLMLNDNVNVSDIIDHLSSKYRLISEKDGVYGYLSDKTVNGTPMTLIYDSQNASVSFGLITPADKWRDFSDLFGKTDLMVNTALTGLGYRYLRSDYGYSKDGSDYYMINDSEMAGMVGFVFNSEKKMCEYWVYMDEGYMSYKQEILTWLKAKYNVASTESSNTQYVFYDDEGRIKVVYDVSGYVSYTDKWQTAFTPAAANPY